MRKSIIGHFQRIDLKLTEKLTAEIVCKSISEFNSIFCIICIKVAIKINEFYLKNVFVYLGKDIRKNH